MALTITAIKTQQMCRASIIADHNIELCKLKPKLKNRRNQDNAVTTCFVTSQNNGQFFKAMVAVINVQTSQEQWNCS